jgi:hypothetical protein
MNMSNAYNDISDQQKVILSFIKDIKEMDALTAMVKELARRLDLAGVAELPSECVCESCGCKK